MSYLIKKSQIFNKDNKPQIKIFNFLDIYL